MNTCEKIRAYMSDRIGEGREYKTRAEMARHLGLSRTTQTKFFDFLDGKDTRFTAISQWLDKLGIHLVLPDEKMEGYELVPRTTAKAGAGESFETSSEVASFYAFRKDFMREIGVRADSAEMMCVSGDSMQPLINNGDTVLIDKADNVPRDGYIYVISYGDALMVKRLQRLASGWNICSENRIYPPVAVEDQELGKLRVYGRVRWIGRVL